ncbi:MAG: hypothetical protein A3A51_02140 [Candidatus Levybacteria bacterium RIFCSPLOWO2_01_FULL_39_10]|nr:MAG: hypothetical protein A3A51_02140 [Candidatus Levybacteria bacterium RIFCSPLOWO2_01_FULL_39_10]
MASNDKLAEQYLRDFGHWHVKMDFFAKQIESLKKLNDFTVFTISAFLLESQSIEFHLQGLLLELDLIKDTENIKYLGRKYKRKAYYDLSLGQLKDELKQYQVDFLKKLIVLLEELNRMRIQFAHHIYSYSTSLDDLIIDADKGIKLSEQVMLEISKVFKHTEQNTWIGHLMTKKKIYK